MVFCCNEKENVGFPQIFFLRKFNDYYKVLELKFVF